MYETQIAAGIKWLNEQDEKGGYELGELWFETIDLRRLSLVNSCSCILGQLEHHILGDTDPYVSSSFWHIVAVKDQTGRLLTFDEAISLGFVLPSGMDSTRSYDRLTDEWYAAITLLREDVAHELGG